MKKEIKNITLVSIFLAVNCFVNVANAGIIPIGGFGVNSNFIDNGVITTEYRADGTVWEWLDLTVTNGISYNSIVRDLSDDNILNNSKTLNAHAGALIDVNGLSLSNASGWSSVSALEVVEMFNAFFGTSLVNGQFIEGNGIVQSSVIEQFISIFGDTYIEGNFDNNPRYSDLDFSKRQVGWASGQTSDLQKSRGTFSITRSRTFIVSDKDFVGNLGLESDSIDKIGLSAPSNANSNELFIGTWLAREITPVPEPTSIAMFTVALLGLAVGRRRRLI
ncbi:PEP-CTERM sorting domain-containing protein [Rheinheimera baltica]|uniref:PEP-CTERM sorting domain-containing protein n=1 Tax=Rheinheimera baltica TaxID=67576 RepID=A0ABT9HZ35_9GAMM|nr:PEP-CTERM sorting domain-containing protein [Rheinheimera baltica]MDP5136403.1 PEP-CTERM sorting domain-containing protein [Rheinheimera baltica]